MAGPSNLDALPQIASVDDWCVHEENPLRHILSRAQAYARLNQLAQAALPQDLVQHTQLACIRDETLIIAADSAAWATRARLQGDLWLAAVQQYWPGSIRQLKFRVQIPGPMPTASPKPRQLADTVCAHLQDCAQRQRDPEMAAILQRLAQKRTQA